MEDVKNKGNYFGQFPKAIEAILSKIHPCRTNPFDNDSSVPTSRITHVALEQIAADCVARKADNDPTPPSPMSIHLLLYFMGVRFGCSIIELFDNIFSLLQHMVPQVVMK